MYLGNCTILPANVVDFIEDCSIDIKARTFFRRISRQEANGAVLYGHTIPLHKDFMVSFHRTKILDVYIYWFDHSGIFYFFTPRRDKVVDLISLIKAAEVCHVS